MSISQIYRFSQVDKLNDYEEKAKRIYLLKDHNLIESYLVQKNIVSKSNDYIFGTFSKLFNSIEKHIFFRFSDWDQYSSQYKPKDPFRGYYNLYLYQEPAIKHIKAIPNNIVQIISIMGGFVTLLTKLISWAINSYQKFQYRKSSVKKLYYYTRTKNQKVVDKSSIPPDNSMTLTRRAQSEDYQMKMLRAVIDSKSVLSFGYSQYTKYFYKKMITNCFVKTFCKCCKPKKGQSTTTERNYIRGKNGIKKIKEETDLIQIVKTLRQARLLIESQMNKK